MRWKSVVARLSLSLVFLVSQVSFADTLTLTGVGGQNTDGVYVYPYYFTATGASGSETLVAMSCLNFNPIFSTSTLPPATMRNRPPTSSSPSGASWIRPMCLVKAAST